MGVHRRVRWPARLHLRCLRLQAATPPDGLAPPHITSAPPYLQAVAGRPVFSHLKRRTPRTSRGRSGSASELRLATASASAPPRIRFTGTSSFLPDSVRGTAGTALDRVGHVARRQLGAQRAARSRARRSSSSAAPGAQGDEQQQLARAAVGVVLEVHDEAVGHLGQRLRPPRRTRWCRGARRRG